MATLTATTAAAISRALKAGFCRSETHTTRIAGWYNVSEGFVAEQRGNHVLVSYEIGDWNRGTPEDRQIYRTVQLAGIGSYLTEKGYEVEYAQRAVVVTGKAGN